VHAVETRELTHAYVRSATVVQNLSMRVPTGSIYGFLGPNGAGKTTTLRLLLGLLPLQSGSIEVLGQSLARNRVALLRRIGCSIETPSVYANLTARENLRVWQLLQGCPRARIDAVLEEVGLARTGSKLAGQFSLGMKQRLGLAAALLHEPELLVLDEPTNGLDPHGIVEMRELLIRLNRERGLTLLVSSHLLSEVERLATEVGIICRGALVFQGPLSELTRRRDAAAFTQIDTDDNARALTVLVSSGEPRAEEARLRGVKLVLPRLSPSEAAAINRTLHAAGLHVHEIAHLGGDLESIYMGMVERAEP